MGIKLKRSAVAGKAPLPADLELGELAVNTHDGKLYLKQDSGTPAIVEIGPVRSVAGQTGAVTLSKTDVGLAQVDNTSDADKPISTATQTALDGKATSSHTHPASQIVDLASQTTLKWLGAAYTVSTAAPTGGTDGDFWFEREV